MLEQAEMDEARLKLLDRLFRRLKAMVHYSKPFVCAITGFAPAGGTILTLCADYRIMAKT